MTPPERRISGLTNRRLRGRGGRRATDRLVRPVEIPCELCEETQAALCAVTTRPDGVFLIYRCANCGSETERRDDPSEPSGA